MRINCFAIYWLFLLPWLIFDLSDLKYTKQGKHCIVNYDHSAFGKCQVFETFPRNAMNVTLCTYFGKGSKYQGYHVATLVTIKTNTKFIYSLGQSRLDETPHPRVR